MEVSKTQVMKILLVNGLLISGIVFSFYFFNLNLLTIKQSLQIDNLFCGTWISLAFFLVSVMVVIQLWHNPFFTPLKTNWASLSLRRINWNLWLIFLSLFLFLICVLIEVGAASGYKVSLLVISIPLHSVGSINLALFTFYLSALISFLAFGKVIKEILKSVGLDLRTVVKATLTTLAETIVVCVMGTLLLLTLGYSLTHAITGMGFAGFSLLTVLLAVVSCPLAIREKGWFPLFSLLAISSPRLHTFYVRAFSLLSRFRFPALISGVRFFSPTEGIDLTLVMAAAIILGIFFMVEVVWHLTFLSEKKSVLQIAARVGRKFILQGLWVSAFFLAIWMVSPYFWTYFLPLLVDGGIKIVDLCERLLLRHFVMIGEESALTEQQLMVLRMESTPPRLEKPAGGSGSFASPVEEGQRSDSLETSPSPSALPEKQSPCDNQNHSKRKMKVSAAGLDLVKKYLPAQQEGPSGVRPPTPRSDLHPLPGRERKAEMASFLSQGEGPSGVRPPTPKSDLHPLPGRERRAEMASFPFQGEGPSGVIPPTSRSDLHPLPGREGRAGQGCFPFQGEGSSGVRPSYPRSDLHPLPGRGGRAGQGCFPFQGEGSPGVRPSYPRGYFSSQPLRAAYPQLLPFPHTWNQMYPALPCQFNQMALLGLSGHSGNRFIPYPGGPACWWTPVPGQNISNQVGPLPQQFYTAQQGEIVAVPQPPAGRSGHFADPARQGEIVAVPQPPAGRPGHFADPAQQAAGGLVETRFLLEVNNNRGMDAIPDAINCLGEALNPSNPNRDLNLLRVGEIVESGITILFEHYKQNSYLPRHQRFIELHHLLVTLANYLFDNYRYRLDGSISFLGRRGVEQSEPLSEENYNLLRGKLCKLSNLLDRCIQFKVKEVGGDGWAYQEFNRTTREHLAQHPEIIYSRRGEVIRQGEVEPGRLSTTLFPASKDPHRDAVNAMSSALQAILRKGFLYGKRQ